MPKIPMDGKAAKRLLGYVWKGHKGQLIAVLICILVSAITGVAGSLFTQRLIDDYITPLLLSPSPVFTGLLQAILMMAVVYLAGTLAAFAYNRIMVSVSQGVLKQIRDGLFARMQALPIRYFDTHSHGDIMSVYTNDTDTLRQAVSQSLPQMFSAVITVVAVFIAMITTSIPLTVLVLLCVAGMLLVSRKVAGKSRRYFIRQQASLGSLNGYIEEMVHGQKVIKVFCHEEKAKEEFDRLNGELFEDADAANKYANILMPIMGNMGHLQYVLVAVVGGALALSGISSLTLGAIAAFLQLSRSFSQPISQMSQQFNSVVMALAGAGRIFALMDEEPETDEGYVSLVNAREENGVLCETEEHTGLWAWKHPHGDGSVTYTKLTGRPPSPIFSTASTTLRTEKSDTTGLTSIKSTRATSDVRWASCCRIPIYSPAPWRKTSVTASRTPPMRR